MDRCHPSASFRDVADTSEELEWKSLALKMKVIASYIHWGARSIIVSDICYGGL
jgi:hypothetical protein